MKLECRINETTTLKVPCGEGEQTLMWLGLVASQMFESRKPRGCARFREGGDSKSGFYLPSMITDSQGNMLPPTATIKSCLEDGQSLNITLQQKVETNSVGAPKMTKWQEEAFMVGEASEVRLEGEMVREAMEKKAERERAKKEKEEERRRKMIHGGASFGIDSSVSVSNITLDSSSKGQYSGQIDSQWGAVEDVVSFGSNKDREELREVFTDVYGLFKDVFVYYVGEDSKNNNSITPEQSGITFAEFTHMLHAARIFHAYKDVEDIRRVFLKCKGENRGEEFKTDEYKNGEIDEEDVTEQSLQLGEFMAAIVYTALHEKSTGTKRSAVSLQSFVEEYLEGHWDNRRDSKMKDIMENESLDDLLTDTRPYIKVIYDFYVGSEYGVMTIDCFQSVCKDAGLLMRLPGEGTNTAEDRMSKVATNAFYSAQGDPPRQLELEEIVFAEFLDATCRLSYETLNSSSSSFQRVQLGIDALLELKKNLR